jgi:hypothetical protein
MATLETYGNVMNEEVVMSARSERRSAPRVLALRSPRELFGESLPELLLLLAVVVAVVSGTLALGG